MAKRLNFVCSFFLRQSHCLLSEAALALEVWGINMIAIKSRRLGKIRNG